MEKRISIGNSIVNQILICGKVCMIQQSLEDWFDSNTQKQKMLFCQIKWSVIAFDFHLVKQFAHTIALHLRLDSEGNIKFQNATRGKTN